MDTCINYCEPDGWAWMSSDERRWINTVRKLAEQKPDECIIMKQPEDNGGFIYAKFPQKWVRVRPPREIVMTDEKREILRKNLQEIRESKAKEKDAEWEDEE